MIIKFRLCYNYSMNEIIKKFKIILRKFLVAVRKGVVGFVTTVGRVLKMAGRAVVKGWRALCAFMKRTRKKLLKSFAKWVDPKLEPYRAKKLLSADREGGVSKDVKIEKMTDADKLQKKTTEAKAFQHGVVQAPQSKEGFLKLLQQTSREVLDYRARQIITMALKLPETTAEDLMVPKSKIVYVRDDETLGPLTLDRLYKSGFEHFPVINKMEEIIGSVHTTSFNNLEIRETSVVSEIVDPGVYYIRADYSLEQVLAAFLRVNCYYFLVVDRYGRTVGMLTFARLVSFLFGDTVTDEFGRDNDRLAVAKRALSA